MLLGKRVAKALVGAAAPAPTSKTLIPSSTNARAHLGIGPHKIYNQGIINMNRNGNFCNVTTQVSEVIAETEVDAHVKQ